MSDRIEIATTFPVGHLFEIEFREFTPRITIDSESELSFETMDGLTFGMK